MIQLRGTRATVRMPDAAWCRDTTTLTFACPDGVSRCVTIPNWRWVVWGRPAGPEPFARLVDHHVANAWGLARIFARRHPAAAVFAATLIREIDVVQRRARYRAANLDHPPSIFDQLDGRES